MLNSFVLRHSFACRGRLLAKTFGVTSCVGGSFVIRLPRLRSAKAVASSFVPQYFSISAFQFFSFSRFVPFVDFV